MVDSQDYTFSRNELYWGKEFQDWLNKKHVSIFGLGGVGGFCAEALARAGIGRLSLIDFDCVSISNINRQIVALNSTVGLKKTLLFEKRLKDINPAIELDIIDDFYTGNMQLGDYDFVADAIDTMRSKVALLESCVKSDIPVISSFGAGNRMDPTQLYISDIKNIENKKDPFVSNLLFQLKKRGIESGLTVVTSREKSCVKEKISEKEEILTKKGDKIEYIKIVPSSTPFVAGVAGMFMASYITKELKKEFENG